MFEDCSSFRFRLKSKLGVYFFASFVLLPSRAEGVVHAKPDDSEQGIFIECLNEYKKFKNTEVFNDVVLDRKEYEMFQLINEKTLSALNPAQRAGRFKDHNRNFELRRSSYNKLSKAMNEYKTKMDALPLTTGNNERTRMELNLQAGEGTFRRARMKLLIQSLECNRSLLDFVTKVPAAQKQLIANASSANKPVEKKPTPGRYGGSRVDRSKFPDSEKLNLTPVDKEFYQTQLGKKLERDLGGMADYWSYDYQRDELYVQVGDEIAKIGVLLEPGGSRIIKTKVGPKFDIVKSPDEKVSSKSDGRFVTGDKNQETLFGKMPDRRPVLVDEGGPAATGTPAGDH